jgi:hypothetical protein
MKLDDRALPPTRRQLDIWRTQGTGRSGTEWKLGLFVRREGLKPDLFGHAIRQALQEAEPVSAGNSDRAANGRRRVGSTRRSHKQIEIQTPLTEPPDEKRVSGRG